jgi:DNA-binding IclR family transcriptional regulator
MMKVIEGPRASRGGAHGSSASGTQAIGRAIALVKLVAASNGQGCRLVDLARSVGVSAPTAHRITAALVDAGLLQREARTHRFHLGDFAINLGILSNPLVRLRDTCRPFLKRLAEATGDTAFLVLRSGAEAVCIDRVEGSYPIRALTLDVGTCRPLGVGAGGLAILASLNAEERAGVYAQRREELQAFALAPGELERMARTTHRHGYAVSAGIVIPGATGVGMAMRLPGGAMAAVSVAAISQRLDAARLKLVASWLEREAAAIERLYGPAREEAP